MKVRLPDGAELYYVIDDFTDPWTTPPTAVLHHGMAKNYRLWYAWVPILARQFRVIRFDARGMGQSSVPDPSYPWSLERFAQDLRDLLDQLDLERVHLIGETVGGTISLRFASLYPEHLLSLTTCTSPIDFADAHHLDIAALVEQEGVRPWVERTITRRLDPQMADPAYIRWYADQRRRQPPTWSAASCGPPLGWTSGPCSRIFRRQRWSSPRSGSRARCLGTSGGPPSNCPMGSRWSSRGSPASCNTCCRCPAPGSGSTSPRARATCMRERE